MGQLRVVNSPITLSESLIGPIRSGNEQLQKDFQELLGGNIYVTMGDIMKVKEYVRVDGSIPFNKWFKGLGEYRINWGPGYRIYLVQEGSELIILFGGGTKRNQQKDIEKAVKLLQEYKSRKKGR